ncbi:hypothetical protein [Microtetraspora malaysiensis]
MRIVKKTGKPASHVARDLGVGEYMLHRWTGMPAGRPSAVEAGR